MDTICKCYSEKLNIKKCTEDPIKGNATMSLLFFIFTLEFTLALNEGLPEHH
jgi:hypothetical protein